MYSNASSWNIKLKKKFWIVYLKNNFRASILVTNKYTKKTLKYWYKHLKCHEKYNENQNFKCETNKNVLTKTFKFN